MNYDGFAKILKKHDKVTGHTTKDKFLGNLVHRKPFFRHEAVLGMVATAETHFNEISRLTAADRSPSGPSLRAEERDMLDALLTLSGESRRRGAGSPAGEGGVGAKRRSAATAAAGGQGADARPPSRGGSDSGARGGGAVRPAAAGAPAESSDDEAPPATSKRARAFARAFPGDEEPEVR